MKIVAVDAYTLNHGDLSWEQINTLGELVLYDRSADSEIVDRCKDADIVLTNKVAFNDKILQHLPSLKLIAVTATGINIIDIEAARNRKVSVCNVPDYGTDSVAQHTFALILELTNRVSNVVPKAKILKSSCNGVVITVSSFNGNAGNALKSYKPTAGSAVDVHSSAGT